MSNRFHCGLVFAAAAAAAMAAVILAEARYTRPSDHGLAFQKAPRGGSPPAMAAFFGGSTGKANVALPKAMNSTQEEAWVGDGGRGTSREGRRERHVRKVLLVTSLVCGITGVGLLVVVAFLFLAHFRSRQTPSSSESGK